MAKNRKFNVAGASIYKAEARAGDIVHFVLGPNNPADKNAIQIINIAGETVGYVPKVLAHFTKSEEELPYEAQKWLVSD